MTTALERLRDALKDRYALERELGAGGMATVYLAQDIKHNRRVAVKVLKPELAATLGADRFTREIQVAAQLQHPHILPLLDSGETSGFFYYVMPYVEGESLRERLVRQGELPVHEAVKILAEVADALAHAHEHGVVHRDIKPDNILLSGRHALVMDFGVAKAVSEATGRYQLTTAGVALGTPDYMAPEQAAADPHLDHRVDIYAVGILAYELLTGRPPFHGMAPQEILAAHVTQQPDPVERRRPGISPGLSEVVTRCLAKRPADRWQSAEELLGQLEPLQTPSGGMTPTATRPVSAVAVPRSRLLVVGAAAGVLIVAALGALMLRRGSAPVTIGRATQVTFEPGLEIEPAISADGRFVAYAAGPLARTRVYVRQPGGRAVAVTPDSGPSQRRPLWSPDGTQLLFFVGGDLVLAPALGGTPRIVVRGGVASAAWAPDGRRVAYVQRDSLFVKGLDGGEPRAIAGYTDMFALAWSPDGSRLAFSAGNSFFATGGPQWFGNTGTSGIFVVAAVGGPVVTVTDRSHLSVSPVWAPDSRHLLFVSNRDGPRDVYAARLDGAGRPSGHPARLTTGLNPHSISLTADGSRIAYSVYTARANIWSLTITSGAPAGQDDAVAVTSGNQTIETMSVSYDGRRLYYDSDRAGNADIYRLSLPDGEPVQLTTDSANEFSAGESPDGRWVAFHSLRYGSRDILVMPAEGGQSERVTSDPGQELYPRFSPDGNVIAYYVRNSGEPNGIYVMFRDQAGRWGQASRVSTIVSNTEWSPRGRELLIGSGAGGVALLSIARDEPRASGEMRTLYQPRPGTADPPAWNARWTPDGRILFKAYDRDGRASFWELPSGGGRPRLLARLDDLSRPSSRSEFATDGRRIYFTIDDRQSDIYVAEITGLR